MTSNLGSCFGALSIGLKLELKLPFLRLLIFQFDQNIYRWYFYAEIIQRITTNFHLEGYNSQYYNYIPSYLQTHQPLLNFDFIWNSKFPALPFQFLISWPNWKDISWCCYIFHFLIFWRSINFEDL